MAFQVFQLKLQFEALVWPEILIGVGPKLEKNCDVILVEFIDDVMVITFLK